MPSPPADDPSWWAWLLDHAPAMALGLGGMLMTAQTVVLSFVWNVASRVTRSEATQDRHTEEIKALQEHRETDVAESLARHQIQNEKLETLATTEALKNVQDTILGEMRTRMSDMTQILMRGR